MFVQLRRAVEGEELSATERAAGTALPGARRLTVAFADMVGFTRQGEAVPPEDLVGLVERLAALAREIIDPPVRFVKTTSDAVMLICPDPVKLVDAMLDLSEAAGRDAKPPELWIGIRVGLGGEPGSGLVRQSGQRSQSCHRSCAAGCSTGGRIGMTCDQ
ncbi:hypothetical protein [Mycobacterium sp. 1465703.0]|uniref:hypothetical protein n=1 Tax=Mycobacterium sp. 1465703.0 TaxID=1834078 RepID=UPI000800A512|nr:hypothetical protein [Mycobacterium sp. 1465703.0]OBJ08864.1 hypothetical protein A5625_14275 [Mycobacterium sp. 1465703.0]